LKIFFERLKLPRRQKGTKKKRATKYEKKVAIDATFIETIDILVKPKKKE